MRNGWISGKVEPKEDGMYVVMVGYGKRVRQDSMHFTVRYGWNTYGHSGENRRDAEDYINSDGYIKAWFQAPPCDLKNLIE